MTLQELPDSDIPGAIEALLFVSDEPVAASTLAEMLEIDRSKALQALEALQERLSSDGSGIQLREVAGGWRLYTHPRYHGLVERYVLSWDTRRLSQAALETLAVVAYCQPVTRALVASVRGVNSDSPLNSLVEKGLVREAGKDSRSPGQPMTYATTKTFLEKFGLASPADLPDLDEFAPDERTRELIGERLGITRAQADEAAAACDDADAALEAGFVSDFSDEFAFEPYETKEDGLVR
ncbi:SMC-Scp complex subunit ScpB [Slackia faecicanis]|uniref:SMC-Scp complex subunit ScpB n=1 Tax=Slackia faecicanis TaxID=255723 RepID=A0A3N0AHE3_9ACTN|nr:SMC-Scp complex subunit ScpB [Slackia faecicanis]RNL21524.1 SMC-Scp complex subunit ScpB [Slackia faecicanis]